jgi:hypothetical protein
LAKRYCSSSFVLFSANFRTEHRGKVDSYFCILLINGLVVDNGATRRMGVSMVCLVVFIHFIIFVVILPQYFLVVLDRFILYYECFI